MRTGITHLLTLATVLGLNTTLDANSVFNQFVGQEVLEITIEADLKTLEDPELNMDYQKALFRYADAQGKSHEYLIKVKARGKFRQRTCDFPPIKLKFKKDDLEARGLEREFNKLKLVTHCLDEKLLAKDYLMREYLTYRLYNEITDQSFRVQLVEVTYVDSNKRNRKFKRMGFLIEPTKEMAARVGGEICDCHGLSAAELDADAGMQMRLFQYMIGNEDWSIPMLRNLKLVKHAETGAIIPVPYDFDFSGLVNAHYAIPNPDFGHSSILQRGFLGALPSLPDLEHTFNMFTVRQLQIEETVKGCKGLSRESRNDVLKYIDTFFKRDYPNLRKEVQPSTEGQYP